MSLKELITISIVKKELSKRLGLDNIPEISPEGLTEYRDIPYKNREGKELFMDIYEPLGAKGTDLPVVINIHGGGLIDGNKELSSGFCRLLSMRGYIVFSLEYRLVPDVRVYEQFDDVCSGMDIVGRMLPDFDVDYRRIFMAAESAGAYLATYVTAMKKSKVLQEAVGYPPAKMNIKALGLICGMFYTTRNDALGRFLSQSFYGNDKKSRKMSEYTNPEHPEIIYNIPPCYLVTSKADMLERYTLDFAGELGNKGIEHRLRHMGSNPELIHAFPVVRPDLRESAMVVDEISRWFTEHSPVDK